MDICYYILHVTNLVAMTTLHYMFNLFAMTTLHYMFNLFAMTILHYMFNLVSMTTLHYMFNLFFKCANSEEKAHPFSHFYNNYHR